MFGPYEEDALRAAIRETMGQRRPAYEQLEMLLNLPLPAPLADRFQGLPGRYAVLDAVKKDGALAEYVRRSIGAYANSQAQPQDERIQEQYPRVVAALDDLLA